MKKPALLAGVLLASSAPSAAVADDSIARLKNLFVGMSLQQLQELKGGSNEAGFRASDFARCTGSDLKTCIGDDLTVARIPARITLYFVSPTGPPNIKLEAEPSPYYPSSHDSRMLTKEEIAAKTSEQERKRAPIVSRNKVRRAAINNAFKLATIEITIDSNDSKDFISAYRLKAGTPSASATGKYTNAFDAEFSGRIDAWGNAETSATFIERCGRIDVSCLYIESIALRAAIRKATATATESRAKDL